MSLKGQPLWSKQQDVIDMVQDSKSAAQQYEPLTAGQGTVEADCHTFHVNLHATHSQNVAHVNIRGKNREMIPPANLSR